jgi:hypothetical protein
MQYNNKIFSIYSYSHRVYWIIISMIGFGRENNRIHRLWISYSTKFVHFISTVTKNRNLAWCMLIFFIGLIFFFLLKTLITIIKHAATAFFPFKSTKQIMFWESRFLLMMTMHFHTYCKSKWNDSEAFEMFIYTREKSYVNIFY